MRLLPDLPCEVHSPAGAAGVATCYSSGKQHLMAQPFDPQTLRLTGEVFPWPSR